MHTICPFIKNECLKRECKFSYRISLDSLEFGCKINKIFNQFSDLIDLFQKDQSLKSEM